MNLFFWKKNKIIDNFATGVADDLFSNIQPNAAAVYLSDNTESDALSKKKARHPKKKNAINDFEKTTRKITEIVIKTRQFKTENSLGVYGRARLHMTFTQRLQELGYSEDTAKQIDRIILLRTP